MVSKIQKTGNIHIPNDVGILLGFKPGDTIMFSDIDNKTKSCKITRIHSKSEN